MAAEFVAHANALAVRQDRHAEPRLRPHRAEWPHRRGRHGMPHRANRSTNWRQDCRTIKRAAKGAGERGRLVDIHSAKGLEGRVFLIGMEQGVLPHANNDDVEEERRVAYGGYARQAIVGITFAEKRFGQLSAPSRS